MVIVKRNSGTRKLRMRIDRPLKGGENAVFNPEVHAKLLAKWSKYYLGPDQKTIIMRIGTMGSGKTSAVNLFIEEVLGFNSSMFSIIDLDKIITTSGYMTSPDKWWDAQVTVGGYKITDTIINASINKGVNFSTESTGKFICPSRKIITVATRLGYSPIGICPYVPFYELKNRIAARAKEEGRDVNTADLEDNLKNMLPKLMEIAPLCDRFYVIHNLVPKGQSPILLLESKTDFTKYNSSKCCEWNSHDEEINKLLQTLEENAGNYTSQNDLVILDLEKKFLRNLLSSSKRAYTASLG